MEESTQLQVAATSGFILHLSPVNTPPSARGSYSHLSVQSAHASVRAMFFKTWIEGSGSAPHDIAKLLKDQQLVRAHILAFRRLLT